MRQWMILTMLALPAGGGEPATTPRQLAFATRDATGFERLGPPRPGDWRDAFKERAQGFEAYVAASPVRAGPGEVLAFLPVGPFTAREEAVLSRAVEFASIWFDLPARTLPAEELPEKGWHRERPWGRQYETTWFLRHLLPERRPRDAVCLFAVTMADLYPEESWHYVFGQASLRDRVGVWSFVRYFPAFWGEAESEAAALQTLRRACKVVVHEAGHAFGLAHCLEFACTMNGSNSLEESDRRPLNLCPPCLRKLQWNRGFDVLARYEKLRAFHETNGLGPEAKWTAERLAAIREAR